MPVDPSVLVIFAAAVVVLTVTPGPDMAFILANSFAGGARAGMAASVGATAGFVVQTMAAAVGLTVIIAALPVALDLIRWAGAVYLTWMALAIALRLWRGGDLMPSSTAPRRAFAAIARGGLVTNLLNPKAILFTLMFLPQFVDETRGAIWLQMTVLAVVLAVVMGPINVAVGTLAGNGTDWLRARPPVQRAMNAFSAVVFLGLALRLALSSRGP